MTLERGGFNHASVRVESEATTTLGRILEDLGFVLGKNYIMKKNDVEEVTVTADDESITTDGSFILAKLVFDKNGEEKYKRLKILSGYDDKGREIYKIIALTEENIKYIKTCNKNGEPIVLTELKNPNKLETKVVEKLTTDQETAIAEERAEKNEKLRVLREEFAQKRKALKLSSASPVSSGLANPGTMLSSRK